MEEDIRNFKWTAKPKNEELQAEDIKIAPQVSDESAVLNTESSESAFPAAFPKAVIKPAEDVITGEEPEKEYPPYDPTILEGPVARDYGTSSIRIEENNDHNELTLNDLLEEMLATNAPDLHITANSKPLLRIKGEILPVGKFPELSSAQIHKMIYEILTPEQQAEFETHKELNLAHAMPGRSRFRVNVYQQRGSIASAIRSIPEKIPLLKELHLPDAVSDFKMLPRGLVLVTGPTGSGKSTTLAAMINEINSISRKHIITIEDPIEFVHTNKKSVINQREVGQDTDSFNNALKNALRQDPDIILLGEMRDIETISTALTAAETGHLVFATLHTQSVVETMARIIDVFPDGAKNQVRAQLASTIQGIVCQSLIRRLDDTGRVAAVEILKGTGAIRSLIRKGQDEQIRTSIETNRKLGMQTMDNHLLQLAKEDVISVEDAVNYSYSPDNMIQSLGGPDGYNKIKRRQESLGGTVVRGF